MRCETGFAAQRAGIFSARAIVPHPAFLVGHQPPFVDEKVGMGEQFGEGHGLDTGQIALEQKPRQAADRLRFHPAGFHHLVEPLEVIRCSGLDGAALQAALADVLPRARGGSVLLDGVEGLEADAQVELLRVLQSPLATATSGLMPRRLPAGAPLD